MDGWGWMGGVGHMGMDSIYFCFGWLKTTAFDRVYTESRSWLSLSDENTVSYWEVIAYVESVGTTVVMGF